MPGVICFAGSFIFLLTRLRISYFPLTVILYIYICARYGSPIERDECASLLYLIIIRFVSCVVCQ